jgi:hypothetical protein
MVKGNLGPRPFHFAMRARLSAAMASRSAGRKSGISSAI